MSVRMRDLLMHEPGALRHEPTDERTRVGPRDDLPRGPPPGPPAGQPGAAGARRPPPPLRRSARRRPLGHADADPPGSEAERDDRAVDPPRPARGDPRPRDGQDQ